MKKAKQTILRELPPVGTKLIGKFKGVPYNGKIVSDKTRSTGKAVDYSGVKYRSMTAAAMAITKQATNGWRFWKIKESK